MKTHYCKSGAMLILLLTAGISLSAQSLEKSVHKEFPASGSSELSIDNQFGKITVTDWDQNNIVVDVNISVTASDPSKAQKLIDKITVDFRESGGKISAETNLEDNHFSSSKNEKRSFKIDYTVKCPKNLALSLTNQFGDIILGSLSGTLKIDLQFGSLNAVNLAGPSTKIDMQFGKVNINTIKDAKFDIQHCELMKILECGNLTIDGQFTTIDAGLVKSLKADLNSCELSVDELSDMLNLDMNMGNMKIGKVSTAFTSIRIDQNMGSVTLGIDPDAGYKLVAEVNMGSISVPSGMKVTKEREGDLPGVSPEKITGTYGNGRSTINIEANMGSVKIK
ncbi:MAG: hypothetical protein PHY99_09535 [Bacteroidales bacterium]|nr:hypothetical protein [Bacteroidales bacterium]